MTLFNCIPLKNNFFKTIFIIINKIKETNNGKHMEEEKNRESKAGKAIKESIYWTATSGGIIL